MIIGSILENIEIEKRVAITPEVIKKYKSLGIDLIIPKGYAIHLGFSDDQYEKEGAKVLENNDDVISQSDLLVQLNILDDNKLNLLKENQSLIGVLNSHNNYEKLKKKHPRHRDVWLVTGPHIFTDLVKKYQKNLILDSKYFYPESFHKNNLHIPVSQLPQKYPQAIMFQYGYTSNNILHKDVMKNYIENN